MEDKVTYHDEAKTNKQPHNKPFGAIVKDNFACDGIDSEGSRHKKAYDGIPEEPDFIQVNVIIPFFEILKLHHT
jgi:hypothetical protein